MQIASLNDFHSHSVRCFNERLNEDGHKQKINFRAPKVSVCLFGHRCGKIIYEICWTEITTSILVGSEKFCCCCCWFLCEYVSQHKERDQYQSIVDVSFEWCFHVHPFHELCLCDLKSQLWRNFFGSGFFCRRFERTSWVGKREKKNNSLSHNINSPSTWKSKLKYVLRVFISF